jgi:hypothetical protein
MKNSNNLFKQQILEHRNTVLRKISVVEYSFRSGNWKSCKRNN